jgi:hypothetical protein
MNRVKFTICLLSTLLGVFCQSGCKQYNQKPNPPMTVIDMHNMGLSGHQEFTEALSTKDLPIEVLRWFTGGIADPGEKYFESDVGDSHLPRRRLLVAGTSAKYCIVNYEVGGIAHGYLVRLFMLNGSKVEAIWTGASGNISTLGELKAAVESGRLVKESHSIW